MIPELTVLICVPRGDIDSRRLDDAVHTKHQLSQSVVESLVSATASDNTV